MPASTTILVSAGAQFGNSATAPSALVLLSTLLVCHTARVRPSSAPSPMCGVLTLPAIHGRNHAPLPKAHHIPLGLGSLFLNAGEREHQLSITELTQVANSDK